MRYLQGRRQGGLEPYEALDAPPGGERLRFRIFVIVFALCLAVGLGYTYLRPAVYETTASLLITPPASASAPVGPEATPEPLGVERHALLANPLLSELQSKLSKTEASPAKRSWTLAELQTLLSVQRFEATNIVELTATGPEPEVLPVIVNLWMDLYLASQARLQQATTDDVGTKLEQQAEELQRRITDKRAEIDAYRLEHDIVSSKRDENRALTRLRGLSNSLNKAKDEELRAQSRLETINAAVTAGKPIASQQDQRRIANLESRAVAIQEEIADFERRFTKKYLELDPKVKTLATQLEVVEQRIAKVRQEAQAGAIAKAEQDLQSARKAVRDLGTELEQSKLEVAEFTSRFAAFEALQEELAQMERVYRQVQDRQVRREVDREREATKIAVREQAVVPTEPIWPNYDRDAAISFAASLVLGLFAVLFFDFFSRPARHARAPEERHVIYEVINRPAAVDADAQEVIAATPAPSLEHRLPRELSEAEVRELLQAADGSTRPLAGALLSGLTVDEAGALCRADVDLEAGKVQIRGVDARVLDLPDALTTAFAPILSDGEHGGVPVWQAPDGKPLRTDELDALLSCAAHDAGLTDAGNVTAETLRHTYIAFLVRQGARLSDLERVTGHLSPSRRAAYATFLPPGRGVVLDQIETVYPALSAATMA